MGERGHETLPHPFVVMVSDRQRAPEGFLERVKSAVRAGVSAVQLREPGLEDVDLLVLAEAVKVEAAGTGARTIVNDRLDVALIAGADGVHLPSHAPPGHRVRAAAPPGFLIGRSVHSMQEALLAEADGGCDYLIFGTVFESVSKPAGHPVAGVEALAAMCEGVSLPVVAIGGVTLSRLPDIVRAGAAGIAAIDLFMTSDEQDMIERVGKIRSAFSAS
jgi:thiamine-phosphate pyrophosphorylase